MGPAQRLLACARRFELGQSLGRGIQAQLAWLLPHSPAELLLAALPIREAREQWTACRDSILRNGCCSLAQLAGPAQLHVMARVTKQ